MHKAVRKKFEKTSGRSAVEAENDNPFNKITDFGTTPRVPAIFRKWCQHPLLMSCVPHAPVARMTVVRPKLPQMTMVGVRGIPERDMLLLGA